MCYYDTVSPSFPAGTCYTFTVYVSCTGGGSCNVGRSANDIQTNITCTEIMPV